MKLSEMEPTERKVEEGEEIDPCLLAQRDEIIKEVIESGDDDLIGRIAFWKRNREEKDIQIQVNRREGPDRLGFPFASRRHGQTRHILMVEDEETGLVAPMTFSPDGHLGAIDD